MRLLSCSILKIILNPSLCFTKGTVMSNFPLTFFLHSLKRNYRLLYGSSFEASIFLSVPLLWGVPGVLRDCGLQVQTQLAFYKSLIFSPSAEEAVVVLTARTKLHPCTLMCSKVKINPKQAFKKLSIFFKTKVVEKIHVKIYKKLLILFSVFYYTAHCST